MLCGPAAKITTEPRGVKPRARGVIELEGSHLVLLYLLQRLNKATNRGIVQADDPADLTERIPMFEMGLGHGDIARRL
jgi:hypothetical protein